MSEPGSPAKLASRPTGRAGTRALGLLATPLNVRLLRAHAHGPQRLPDVQEQAGWPPQSTLRLAVRTLRDVGALGRSEVPGTPYAVVNRLTPAGEELLGVANIVEAWLSRAPGKPIDAESDAAKVAIKALAEAWSASILKVLALGPATLSDLDKSISEATYPSLERRLTRMRHTGQVERATRPDRGTPFQATEWLRASVGPLCGAARWEQRHLGDGDPGITGTDVATLLLLAAALPMPLSRSAAGRLFLGVPDANADAGEALAGLMVEVEDGRLVAATPELYEPPQTWALGTPESWLDTVLDGNLEKLRIGGVTPQLAVDIAKGIHRALGRR